MKETLRDRLAQVANRSTLQLTHYGRKTGKAYQVTIWFAVDGETIYLPTMNTARQWARNVKRTPRVRLEIGAERFDGTVAPLTEQKEMRRVSDLLVGKYWILWALDWLTTLVGCNPRQQKKLDLGRGGLFRVELQDAPSRQIG